jgi:hypothetical protein
MSMAKMEIPEGGRAVVRCGVTDKKFPAIRAKRDT